MSLLSLRLPQARETNFAISTKEEWLKQSNSQDLWPSCHTQETRLLSSKSIKPKTRLEAVFGLIKKSREHSGLKRDICRVGVIPCFMCATPKGVFICTPNLLEKARETRWLELNSFLQSPLIGAFPLC